METNSNLLSMIDELMDYCQPQSNNEDDSPQIDCKAASIETIHKKISKIKNPYMIILFYNPNFGTKNTLSGSSYHLTWM